MRTLFLATAAFAALVMIAPVGKAFAGQSLTPRLAEVDAIAKTDPAPEFHCSDPGERSTCQIIRSVVKGSEAFATYDKANGEHTRCFFPNANGDPPFGLCEYNDGVDGSALVNGSWTRLPKHDPRCSDWGGADTHESAMPQTLAGADKRP
jgi:hypothetical protein